MDNLYARGLRFVDGQGRTRIFNGMNIQEKQGGRSRLGYDLDDAFFQKYTARGLNLIRLAVVWENLEPRPGRYNEGYLRSVDEAFDRAARYGVYIFLDLHQDLYGDMGMGDGADGAPQWAQVTGGAKPRKPKWVWSENYILSKAVRRCFDNFWRNSPVPEGQGGIQDHFAALWAMLARRYGDHPALFGFDFLNEPFSGSSALRTAAAGFGGLLGTVLLSRDVKPGTLLADLLRKNIPGVLGQLSAKVMRQITGAADASVNRFDREKLGPFQSKMGAAVREETQRGFLVLGQSIFCSWGIPFGAPAIAVGGRRDPNQCYAPHAYDLMVETPGLNRFSGNERVAGFFSVIADTQERLQMPVVVGEWGGGGNDEFDWFPHARFLRDFFDRHHWSQTYWCYREGCLDSPLMAEVLCRSYPQAVAGRIERYEHTDDAFTLDFSQAPADCGETLLYLHRPFVGIECDGMYETVAQYDTGACVLRVKTDPGSHRVKILFQ
ncbi:MAG: cellulase family glycosylhydrolase [Oscillospiraceae bacterium]|jgi:endoglycosylceramidase|nr:cellulase family glycosylhydrolase [Oscillospiraceae bacterium]